MTARVLRTAFLAVALLMTQTPALLPLVAQQAPSIAAASDGSVVTWTSRTNLPAPRFGASSVHLNGYLYVVGGALIERVGAGNAVRDSVSTVYRARINESGSLGAFSAVASLNQSRLFPGVVARGDSLYVFGGYGGGNTANNWAARNTIERATLNADGALGAWTILPTTLTSARGQPRTFAPDFNDRVYLFGGSVGFGTTSHLALSTVESITFAALDGSTPGTWRSETSLPSARRGHGATGVGANVYVGGGFDSTGQVTKTIYRGQIHPTLGTVSWSTLATQMPVDQGIGDHAQEALNGYLYVAGGTGNQVNQLDWVAIAADGTLGSTWSNNVGSPQFSTATYSPMTGVGSMLYYVAHNFDRTDTVEITVHSTPPPPPSAISGVATCNNDLLLYGATVDLYSGSVLVATTTASTDTAVYAFTGVAGNATYRVHISKLVPPIEGPGDGVLVECDATTTTDANGGSSVPSGVSIPNNYNHTWNTALALTPGAPVQDYVFQSGQSTWFKVPVRPGQRVTVRLSGVPTDYSLALYKDIRKLYDAQVAALGGEDPLGAVNDFDASVAPDALSPDALSPDALSPDALSPDALSPDELSPDALSPDALSPDALSPDALSPDELSAEAYAAAQTAALIGVSAHIGLSPEQITRNTWDNDGHFYMRVRGHNGAFDASRPFTIEATVIDVSCGGATLASTPISISAPPTNATSLILTNTSRLTGDTVAFGNTLASLAGHAAVLGAVADLGTIPGVASAYTQWDQNQSCPAAANIVAHAVKDVVNAYRTANPGLRYVVLAGNDHVIPFLRQPDQSGLGNEKDYFPAVLEPTASQASLRLGHVLTQDFYGSTRAISRFDHVLYLPDLGVGRLVETTDQMTAVIDAFLATNGAAAPTSALVAGYDFLSDAAAAIADDLSANAVAVDRDLIQPVGDGPTDPTAWTATQLGTKLFGASTYGIVNVNAHFSANALLAADFATRLQPSSVTSLPASDTRFRNALILSTGCHSGYNIVDPHATALTPPVDWTQAFAARGATMVGGTGYQYGDTDFIKYSEKLYAGLVRQLRYGSGPVRIGAALTAAKLDYISSLAQLGGIDEKSLVQMSLYGLPMMGFDLPAASRLVAPGPSTVTGLTPLTSDGLSVAEITPDYELDPNVRTLDIVGGGSAQALYYDIGDNVAVQPGMPVLPQLSLGVSVAGRAVRGAVLHSATYADEAGVTPFTDVATTEVRGVHPRYVTDVFTPVRPFDLNHFSGSHLVSTPFQYRSDAGGPTGTARRFTDQTFRLYYSDLTDARALAAAPVVYRVALAPNGTSVDVETIVGALADVGIEEVFATYTAENGSLYGQWASLTLTPVSTTTNGAGLARTYRGSIPLGTSTAESVRVILQTVGGNGLVTWSSDQGAYYRVHTESATASDPKDTTALSITVPASGAYRSRIAVSARLTSGGAGLAGKPVAFRVGGARADATTDGSGYANAELVLDAAPGPATVRVGFAEDAGHLASGAAAEITVTKAASSFATFDTVPTPIGSSAIVATLSGGSGPLGLQLVTLVGGGRTVQTYTDGYGRVRLDTADGFPIGAYTVAIDYAGNDRYLSTSATTLVVVYDTSTSVVGGGWISIPTGSEGLASGRKMTFGANVRFKPGSTTPTGHLEIVAKEAGLTLRASSMEWLLVTAGTAITQGRATVNGTTGWSFRLTLVDGTPDRFELRVWQDGVTTYDAPTYRTGNALGGGNITVR